MSTKRPTAPTGDAQTGTVGPDALPCAPGDLWANPCSDRLSRANRVAKHMPESHGATLHLHALVAGDRSAADRLAPLVYDELRALAGSFFAHENPGHTLQPTAIADEAFIRLIGQTQADWQGRAHFMAVAAVLMRRILVDHSRQRNAVKRGGDCGRVTLTGLDAPASEGRGAHTVDVESIDRVLTELADLNQRQARVVEMRFFAGMSVEETAVALGVSEKTVKNDWRFARAWLHDRLSATR